MPKAAIADRQLTVGILYGSIFILSQIQAVATCPYDSLLL